MSGTTDRQNQAQRISGGYEKMQSDIAADPSFGLFDNYNQKYGVGQQRTALDNVFNSTSNMFRRTGGNAVASASNRLNSNLASRGITGGSVLNDANANSANGIYSNMFNALEKLGIGRQKAETGMLNNANKYDFMGRQARLNSTKSQYGLESGALTGQTQNLGGFSDTNGFDDVLASLNTLGNLAKGAGSIATGGGLSAIW